MRKANTAIAIALNPDFTYNYRYNFIQLVGELPLK